MTLTTEQLRVRAESLGLDFFIEQRAGVWVKEWNAGACVTANAQEVEMWLLLANREAQPVAWEMRYWNNGYNCWHDWERITAEQHAEMSMQHATDNDCEFRVLYDAPPAPAVPELITEDEQEEAVSEGYADSFRGGWNACRAAMLNHVGDANEKAAEKCECSSIDYCESCLRAMLAQPVSGGYKLPEGFKLVPVESTDEWAERYCELTNKHPDGGLTTYIGDGAVTITFREKSKREIDAMLAAAPGES
ncbi:TPA: hypothetical protein I9761_003149 [Serratia marcescens]|nr:hypothetical protein [Serratia marcescens]HAT5020453.1 hypothetical protein [Serratia marcescens]